jgi:hypothetical protein
MDETTLFAANGLNDVPEWWLRVLVIGGFVVACGLVAALAWFINRRFK